jgi:hypothetical protein
MARLLSKTLVRELRRSLDHPLPMLLALMLAVMLYLLMRRLNRKTDVQVKSKVQRVRGLPWVTVTAEPEALGPEVLRQLNDLCNYCRVLLIVCADCREGQFSQCGPDFLVRARASVLDGLRQLGMTLSDHVSAFNVSTLLLFSVS